jgi:hypothetical protein
MKASFTSISPFMVSPTYLSTTSPFLNIISTSDSIIPPTVFPFNPQGVIITSDIYIPHISVVSQALATSSAYGGYDVCDTSNIREQVTKVVYYKLLDKWLYKKDTSKHLLKYLKVNSDGKVSLIDNLEHTDDYKKNSKDIIEKKVGYIEKHLVQLDDVYAILKKFVEETRISWCDVTNNMFIVRKSIEKSVSKKIKRLIEKK